jgi:hypothetical protein
MLVPQDPNRSFQNNLWLVYVAHNRLPQLSFNLFILFFWALHTPLR